MLSLSRVWRQGGRERRRRGVVTSSSSVRVLLPSPTTLSTRPTRSLPTLAPSKRPRPSSPTLSSKRLTPTPELASLHISPVPTMGNDSAVRLHAELVEEWSKGADEGKIKGLLAVLKVSRWGWLIARGLGVGVTLERVEGETRGAQKKLQARIAAAWSAWGRAGRSSIGGWSSPEACLRRC